MKLVIKGRAGSRVCDWNSYALFRDNVQHFVEQGEPSVDFQALHAIERAVDTGRGWIDAPKLRGELFRAWHALSKVSLDEAAVSIRSRAILTGSLDEPMARGTVSARQVGWELPVQGKGNVQVLVAAGPFVMAILALTERASDGDRLEIRREGEPPRFANTDG